MASATVAPWVDEQIAHQGGRKILAAAPTLGTLILLNMSASGSLLTLAGLSIIALLLVTVQHGLRKGQV